MAAILYYNQASRCHAGVYDKKTGVGDVLGKIAGQFDVYRQVLSGVKDDYFKFIECFREQAFQHFLGDLGRAVKAAVEARTVNNGQSCIAAKRFIVDAGVADEFEGRVVAGMAALRVGDPMDETTEVGPLATPAIVDALDAQAGLVHADGAGGRARLRARVRALLRARLRADLAQRLLITATIVILHREPKNFKC